MTYAGNIIVKKLLFNHGVHRVMHGVALCVDLNRQSLVSAGS